MVKESGVNVKYSTKSHEIVINGSTLKKVRGDFLRLEQILVNLLSNAVKYSPDHNKIEVNLSSDDHLIVKW